MSDNNLNKFDNEKDAQSIQPELSNNNQLDNTDIDMLSQVNEEFNSLSPDEQIDNMSLDTFDKLLNDGIVEPSSLIQNADISAQASNVTPEPVVTQNPYIAQQTPYYTAPSTAPVQQNAYITQQTPYYTAPNTAPVQQNASSYNVGGVTYSAPQPVAVNPANAQYPNQNYQVQTNIPQAQYTANNTGYQNFANQNFANQNACYPVANAQHTANNVNTQFVQNPNNTPYPANAGQYQNISSQNSGAGYPAAYPQYPANNQPQYYQYPNFNRVAPPVRKKSTGFKVFMTLLSLVVVSSMIIATIAIVNTAKNYSTEDNDNDYYDYSDDYDFDEFFDSTTQAQPTIPEDLPLSEYLGSNAKINLVPIPTYAPPKGTQAVAQAAKSVVGIEIYSLTDATIGAEASGVIVTNDGYLVTNDHVYESVPNAKFLVTTTDGMQYHADYVAGDTQSDLAILKIDGTGFTPAAFASTENLNVGDEVYAIGSPGGMELIGSVTSGVVSALDRRLSGVSDSTGKHIQTDAPINPGNSGGALVNQFGQVVGINSSKVFSEGYEGLGFAIPSETVSYIFSDLLDNGIVNNRARLGITYTTVDTITAEIDSTKVGLLINDIDPKSDLYSQAKINETIIGVNGTEVKTDADMLEVIEASKPGDTITLTIYDIEGDERDVECELMPSTTYTSYTVSEPIDND